MQLSINKLSTNTAYSFLLLLLFYCIFFFSHFLPLFCFILNKWTKSPTRLDYTSLENNSFSARSKEELYKISNNNRFCFFPSHETDTSMKNPSNSKPKEPRHNLTWRFTLIPSSSLEVFNS